jgi:Fe-Mn family superoxide dismutase
MLEDITTILCIDLAPNTGVKPIDTLAAAISRFFGSYVFVTTFKSENKQFGSAWVWLVVDKSGKLQVTVLKIKITLDEKRSYSRDSHLALVYRTCLLSWLSIPKKKYIDFSVLFKSSRNYEAAFRKILKVNSK